MMDMFGAIPTPFVIKNWTEIEISGVAHAQTTIISLAHTYLVEPMSIAYEGSDSLSGCCQIQRLN